MSVLVLVPCDDGRPADGALAALGAAQALGPLQVLACGPGAAAAAAGLALLPQVQRVLVLEAPALPRAEAMAPWLAQQCAARGCTHLVATALAWPRALLPRTAALLDLMAVTEVVKIVDADTFVRPVHAGAALTTLRVPDALRILTVRASAFEPPQPQVREPAPVEAVAPPPAESRSASALQRQLPQADGSVALIGARVVVSGGRGTGSAAGFDQLRPLAQALGAAVGASRAAVDAGYAPADRQVGQTGKSVAPELYFALGISGAVQHWAGMKDSKVIVAVNKDPEAPIFQFADYGLVADLFEVLPALQSGIAALPPRS
ncbi:MAG: electron transfer flavoprotein subunit alpha/FixB family protein [Proteobacteria bacterium]|nr:electron transfer flavoprotein subunit alpha/FixB family protein [Pseudomonadota bacterium]